MKITREFKFSIGQIVYLRTDVEQLERIVIGYMILMGFVQYILMQGVEQTNHFDFEITPNRNILYTLN
ncbi:hypothetical protein UFOVP211_42 [uncultured Caudovirales phage]|uniref:Uncharacterized protein n=1 Tax=uncultured Caudovirales phage TaxID=2100421 RepID=A0A6J7WPJ0_9CAUD|nr:hypothetical protein UFOVP211_42 [uncultured Caudovirales phage]